MNFGCSVLFYRFGVNYTGNQAEFINNFIAISAVPEPSTLLLVTLGALAIPANRMARRRRAEKNRVTA